MDCTQFTREAMEAVATAARAGAVEHNITSVQIWTDGMCVYGGLVVEKVSGFCQSRSWYYNADEDTAVHHRPGDRPLAGMYKDYTTIFFLRIGSHWRPTEYPPEATRA